MQLEAGACWGSGGTDLCPAGCLTNRSQGSPMALKNWESNNLNAMGGGRRWRIASHRPSDWRGRGSYLLRFEQSREREGVK